ncbi:MAG: ABC transporter ATP-binding protein [Desulfobacterales bacterium]|nr:MAG: ABC transporter ATP-binding protein [Desulfobacterales bacterium]
MRDNFGYDEGTPIQTIGDFHLWQRIITCCRGYGYHIAAAIFLSLLITGATLALPYLIKNGIDLYITATELSAEQRLSGLGRIGIIFCLLSFVVFFITFIQLVMLEWIGQSIMHQIRHNLFMHIIGLDLSFLDKQPTGRIVTRLTNDIQNMHEMFTSVMVTLFNDILRLAGILVVLFMINTRLALVMTIFTPLSLLITIIFSRLARERFRAIRSQLSKLNTFIQESVSGIAIIQLFNRQRETAVRFSALSNEYLKRTLSQIRLFGIFMPMTELLSGCAIALILWYGGREIIGYRLTLGELAAFLGYMRLFFQPLRELSQKYSIVQAALASAERIFTMLDIDRTIKDPEDAQSLADRGGRIDFNDVCFSYEDNKQIINTLNLTILPGETIAVVGTTGSGKTTLISLLLRFYEPQQGRISIDHTDIKQLSLNDLRQKVGVVLQDVFILDDSLLANIVLNSARTRADVEQILQTTGLTDVVKKLPDGLDTRIGEGGHELSTGEKQLLSFCRALCRDPAILVLDEATASIDPVTESILEKAVADSFKNRTSIVIAHRLSTIRRADRIIVMNQGQIVEQGSHNELLHQDGLYAEMIRNDLLSQPEE